MPLSDQAIRILEALKACTGEGKYLFPSPMTAEKPIADVTLLSALRRMGYAKHEICIHGFRGMASMLLKEQA